MSFRMYVIYYFITLLLITMRSSTVDRRTSLRRWHWGPALEGVSGLSLAWLQVRAGVRCGAQPGHDGKSSTWRHEMKRFPYYWSFRHRRIPLTKSQWYPIFLVLSRTICRTNNRVAGDSHICDATVKKKWEQPKLKIKIECFREFWIINIHLSALGLHWTVAWRLFSAKPIPELIMTFAGNWPFRTIFCSIWIQLIFCLIKYISKRRLKSGRHYVHILMCWLNILHLKHDHWSRHLFYNTCTSLCRPKTNYWLPLNLNP